MSMDGLKPDLMSQPLDKNLEIVAKQKVILNYKSYLLNTKTMEAKYTIILEARALTWCLALNSSKTVTSKIEFSNHLMSIS